MLAGPAFLLAFGAFMLAAAMFTSSRWGFGIGSFWVPPATTASNVFIRIQTRVALSTTTAIVAMVITGRIMTGRTLLISEVSFVFFILKRPLNNRFEPVQRSLFYGQVRVSHQREGEQFGRFELPIEDVVDMDVTQRIF